MSLIMNRYADIGVHGENEMTELADVHVITSGGLRILAHSNVLAFASTVLDRILNRPQIKEQNSEKTIRILGVSCDAVSVFLRFLYCFRCSKEQMEKHGIHLLALSHVYLVPSLKHRCTKALTEQLTIENVVDMLQLARLCDAPHLYLKSMKFLQTNFRKIEKTEGWKFLQHHDPLLELEILQLIDEADSRKKRRRRHMREQNLYLQLSEGMDCLEHICSEGCTSVGPYEDKEYSSQNKLPCSKFDTCRGLQLLIRHFSTCKQRAKGNCSQCKRMWQLLRLHASICDQPDDCRVPLCRVFKQKVEKKGDDELWKSLVRKVVSARVISSLSLPKRKREAEEEQRLNLRHHQVRKTVKSYVCGIRKN